ncbi:MAG: hypothetical protein ACYC3F_16685 [Gemmatimonadaceae bacterium]
MSLPKARKPKYQSSAENLKIARARLEEMRAPKAPILSEPEIAQVPEKGPKIAQNGGCDNPGPAQYIEPDDSDSSDEEIVIKSSKKGANKNSGNDFEFKMAMMQMAKDIKKLKKLKKDKLKARNQAQVVPAPQQIRAQAPMNGGQLPGPVPADPKMSKTEASFFKAQLMNTFAAANW